MNVVYHKKKRKMKIRNSPYSPDANEISWIELCHWNTSFEWSNCRRLLFHWNSMNSFDISVFTVNKNFIKFPIFNSVFFSIILPQISLHFINLHKLSSTSSNTSCISYNYTCLSEFSWCFQNIIFLLGPG